jgi:flagellar hook-associated protein 3 FlgL
VQSQVSSGLKVAAPSDDPAAMENTLDYQAQNAAQAQYSSNISTLLSRAGSVYNVLQSLQTVSSRAGEIATTVGGATNSQTTLDNYANEVNHLINQVVTAANTKDPSTGQYLFGGTASTSAPFTATTDASGNVTGVTYNGNSSVNQAQIGAGMTATADIPGTNTGSSGAHGLITDSQSGADLINHLIALRDNLNAGNTAAITNTDSANLQKDENNVTYQVANNGVVQSQLNLAATFATNYSQSLDKMISNTSSADLVQTMVQLSQTQTAYQAALQSGAKIMQLSILNYLS